MKRGRRLLRGVPFWQKKSQAPKKHLTLEEKRRRSQKREIDKVGNAFNAREI